MQKFVYKENGRNKVIIGRSSKINIESSGFLVFFFNFLYSRPGDL